MENNTLPVMCITGSSGMIGTKLFETLTQQGYSTFGIDKKKNAWNYKLNNHTENLDILKLDELMNVSAELDIMIHLAANSRVYYSITNPQLALDNIISTFNVLEYLRRKDITKIIFSSSREVYGNEKLAITGDTIMDIKKCENPYAASKISSESLIYSYCKTYGIDYVILRLSNVYGPYDISNRVIPKWIEQTLSNKDLILYGKNKKMDFIYLDDVISGMTEVINMFNAIKGNTFNFASGVSVHLKHLGEQIIKSLNGNNKIIIKSKRIGEVVNFQVNMSGNESLLEYKPKINLKVGLSKTIEWYKNYLFCMNKIRK